MSILESKWRVEQPTSMLQKKSKERDELDKGLPLRSVANLLDEHGMLISSVFFSKIA